MRRTVGLGLLVGCADPSAASSVGWTCEVQGDTVLSPDEVTPAGYSARDVAARVGAFDGAFVWADGAPSTLALTPTVDLASARWVDVDLEGSGDSDLPAPALDCPDRVELTASVGFQTADGRFAEELDWTLEAADLGLVTSTSVLNPGELSGTWTPEAPDAEDPGATLRVRAAWSGQGSFGEVDLGSDAEDRAWVASW